MSAPEKWLKTPICPACGEPITPAQWKQTELWHGKFVHFICYVEKKAATRRAA